jgi:transcriptional regulator with PAS, ATPase and Fis domain
LSRQLLRQATLTEPLLESELFGHERGAFTGAVKAKPGLIESASGGTVFLDEIGELPERLQPKLLQVLEHREVLRLGSVQPRAVDVRFVAATNRDLAVEIAGGRFRSDLYFRLATFAVPVAPLRERREDVLPLAEELLRSAVARTGGARAPAIADDAAAALRAHDWPGNVRELRNVIERALLIVDGRPIGTDDLQLTPIRPTTEVPASESRAAQLTGAEAEDRARILDALIRCRGNQTETARMLGISRSTLLHRLDAYRISRPRKRPSTPA